MQKTISAIKVRQNLGQVMNEVALKADEYIVERAGKPLVAIIPIGRYQNLKQEREVFLRTVGGTGKAAKKADSSIIDHALKETVAYAKALETKQNKRTLSELSGIFDMLPKLGDDLEVFKKDLSKLRKKQPPLPKGRKWE